MTVDDYINNVDISKKNAIIKLRATILKGIPKGFEERMIYNMPGYVVPFSAFPDGYHCDPKLPLPFINIAAQKNFIALYHMGLYADQPLYEWFVSEYPKHSSAKLDMGKSCIRFKNPDQIPYDLILQLMKKMTVEQWIKLYKENVRK